MWAYLLLSYILWVTRITVFCKFENVNEKRQKNVLFIMYDDLRPQLSIYGKKYMHTPNFERLASRSVVFDNAFCQIAVCSPSRNSLLTSRRPDTTGHYEVCYLSYVWLP